MRLGLAAVMGAGLLGGCATVPEAGRPVAIEAETIRYETSPCFGTCPVYSVVVQPDGRGTFEGKRFTAVTGVREFTVTPDQYRRFKAALQPYRPAEGERLYGAGTPLCSKHYMSDQPSVNVYWTEPSGALQHLLLYYACDDAAMHKAVWGAPDFLPIDKLVKPETPFPPGR